MSNQTQTILITGASTGIGFAVARAFVDRGSNLVINSKNSDRLEAAYEALGRPENTLLVVGDVSDKAVGQQMVDAALGKFGRIDVLVNNAGIFSPKPFLDVEEADLDHYYAINLKGTYFTSQAAISAMRAQGGGSIINVGTVLVNHALGGFPASAAVASKGAVHALTLQLAAEFGKDKIRVNTIAPGIVRTPIHARNGIENVDDLAGLALLDRVGEGEEAADTILHLAAANFTTGVVYPLDGGYTAGHHIG
jgi:NAD(P)-dependent dehydrogenase (short-subunit alcohol dehydrogenase family)